MPRLCSIFGSGAYACWKQKAYHVFVRLHTYNRTIDEEKLTYVTPYARRSFAAK
jgi:hypothetical protein